MVKDGWPVIAEDFKQWVVEGNFCNGMPAWDKVEMMHIMVYILYHVDPSRLAFFLLHCTLAVAVTLFIHLSLSRMTLIYQVGALVVKDVKPYEFMKLRLLNGGHSCLSYISVLCGYSYVDDAMSDPLISGKALFTRV